MNNTLVLDLDESLLHSFKNDNFKSILSDPILFREYFPIGDYPRAFSFYIAGEDFYGLYRPYSQDFLLAASKYFKNIIVWSAADREYVIKIVKAFFIDNLGIIPKLVLTRDNCEYNKDLDILYKPLNKLKKYLPDIDLDNTLIIDDREENFVDNPGNSILIPPFEVGENNYELNKINDNYLLRLKHWLESDRVKNSNNYILLDKTRIFL